MKPFAYLLVPAFVALMSCNPPSNDVALLQKQVDDLNSENQILKSKNDSLEVLVANFRKEYGLDNVTSDGDDKILSSYKLQITKVKTGYIHSDYDQLFLPAITLEFKNLSQNDLSESIKLDAYFIDENTGEQIAKDYSFFIDKYSVIIGGMTKQVTLQSSVGWRYLRDTKVQARLYINDNFYKSYEIENTEYFGRF